MAKPRRRRVGDPRLSGVISGSMEEFSEILLFLK